MRTERYTGIWGNLWPELCRRLNKVHKKRKSIHVGMKSREKQAVQRCREKTCINEAIAASKNDRDGGFAGFESTVDRESSETRLRGDGWPKPGSWDSLNSSSTTNALASARTEVEDKLTSSPSFFC